MSDFILGGRLGDLIHALWVVKNTPGKHNLYITDRRDLHSDGFVLPLVETVDELAPILMAQDYVQSFGELMGDREAVNLSMWRRHAYSASWTQLLSNTFGPTANGNPWIEWPKKKAWSDVVIIHRSVHEARKGHNWDLVMSKYGGQAVFIGSQAERALFNYNIPHYEPTDLADYFTIIASCKYFIGNQSGPLAIAHSLGTPRLAMLNEVDKIHYVGEEKWHPNFSWIAESLHNWEGINY